MQEIDRWVVKERHRPCSREHGAPRASALDASRSTSPGVRSAIRHCCELIVAELARTQGGAGAADLRGRSDHSGGQHSRPARSFGDALSELAVASARRLWGRVRVLLLIKHLPFNFLKIDGEFVRNCRVSHTDRLLIRAVGTSLVGAEETVAEIVGDDETVQLLTSSAWTMGRLSPGRPAPIEEAFAATARRRRRAGARADHTRPGKKKGPAARAFEERTYLLRLRGEAAHALAGLRGGLSARAFTSRRRS